MNAKHLRCITKSNNIRHENTDSDNRISHVDEIIYFYALIIPQQEIMNRKTKPNPKLSEIVQQYERRDQHSYPAVWDDKTYFKLIDFYTNQGSIERALEVANTALSHYKFRTDFYLLKANLLMGKMQLNEAKGVLEQAAKLSPYDRQVQILKCKLLALQGHSEEALILVDEIKLIFHKTDITDLLLLEAFISETMKDFEKMFYTLKELLTHNPDNVEALEQIWVSVEFSKKYEESINLHLELIDRNPYSYLAWFNLGHAYSCLGEYEKALEALEYSFIINVQFEQGYLDCAELAVQMGQFEKAVDIYTDVLAHFGNDGDVVAYLSDCLIRLERYKDAKKILHKAYKADPYNDEICYYLGLCYMRCHETDKAIDFLKEAITIEEYREEYHASLAECYSENGELHLAEIHFAKAARTGMEQSQYWTRYISFLLQNRNFEKAYKTIIRADKYSVGADLLFCKAAYHYLTGHRDHALEVLKEAIQDDQTQLEIFTSLAPASMEDSDFRGFIRYYCQS